MSTVAGICGLLLLAGCAPTSPPPAAPQASVMDNVDIVTLDVGGTAIRFAPIDGWCIDPPESLAQSLQMLNSTSPQLIAYSTFSDCGEIEAARALNGLVPDGGYIATPKEYLDKDLGENRAAFVKVAAAELRRTGMDEGLSEGQNQVVEALGHKNVDVQFGKTTNLGVVDQDQDAVYFAVIQSVEATSAGRTTSLNRLTVGAITLLRGRVIMLYLWSDNEPDPTLDPVLARCKAQVERLIVLNPNENNV